MRRTQYEIWEQTFLPLKNPLKPDGVRDGMVDGCMLESYSPDFAVVQAAMEKDPNTVWTLVEGDNGKLYICQGFHRVNRVGYVITTHPYEPGNAQHEKRFGQKATLYA